MGLRDLEKNVELDALIAEVEVSITPHPQKKKKENRKISSFFFFPPFLVFPTFSST